MNNSKPILFATLGYPGSGKTYFSRKFAKDFHILHLNSDRVRKSMFKKPKYNWYENQLVFSVMDAIMEEALAAGVSVIYDANSTLREYRKRMQKTVKKHGASFFLLWFKTTIATAKKRLGTRKRCTTKSCSMYHPPIPREVFERLRTQIQEPTIREPHIILNGADTYAKQKKALLGALSEDNLFIS